MSKSNTAKKGRPLSKITTGILALKPGQKLVMPQKFNRTTLGSYVYNANSRRGVKHGQNNHFGTTIVNKGGRKYAAVVAY